MPMSELVLAKKIMQHGQIVFFLSVLLKFLLSYHICKSSQLLNQWKKNCSSDPIYIVGPKASVASHNTLRHIFVNNKCISKQPIYEKNTFGKLFFHIFRYCRTIMFCHFIIICMSVRSVNPRATISHHAIALGDFLLYIVLCIFLDAPPMRCVALPGAAIRPG